MILKTERKIAFSSLVLVALYSDEMQPFAINIASKKETKRFSGDLSRRILFSVARYRALEIHAESRTFKSSNDERMQSTLCSGISSLELYIFATLSQPFAEDERRRFTSTRPEFYIARAFAKLLFPLHSFCINFELLNEMKIILKNNKMQI